MSSSCIEEVSISDDSRCCIADELPSRTGIIINGSAPTDIRVEDPDLFKRVLQEGFLGLDESYMDGRWEYDRLGMSSSRVLRAGFENQLPHYSEDTLRIASARLFSLQSKKRAWIVGKEHYDLGNDSFSRMLDPFIQYSCAYWKDVGNLESAQQAEFKMICEKLQLKPGMRVLDTGCDWGGLAYYMVSNYNVSVVDVAISAEQQKMAQKRREDLDITILLQDYRDPNDQLDRIVPVEVFRRVEPKNCDTYFAVVDHDLKPEGIFLLHTIGSRRTDLNVNPQTNKYTFPNGCLPSVHQIAQSNEPHFVMENWRSFGADYDTTLMAWYERFPAAWPEIASNYSEHFRRMFIYYLNTYAGAFRARDIQLWQVVLSRGIENNLRIAR